MGLVGTDVAKEAASIILMSDDFASIVTLTLTLTPTPTLTQVGDDGWCVHFDKEARACTAFQDRPWFCRVESGTFAEMYDVRPNEMDRYEATLTRTPTPVPQPQPQPQHQPQPQPQPPPPPQPQP